MKSGYVPDAGDIVWLHFDPQAGHEQAGRRPALVLTPARYNGVRGMMICCPMTTRIKGYVFEVVISRKPPSAVLADQLESLDWRARRALWKRGSFPRRARSSGPCSHCDNAFGRLGEEEERILRILSRTSALSW